MRWYQWAIPFAIGAGWELYRMWRKAQRAPVLQVGVDDAEMGEAIARARATLPEFLRVLAEPQPGHRDFAIKGFFPDLGEHMWVSDPAHMDGQLVGRLGNHPATPGKLRLGDEVRVPEDRVTDWKYVQHDVLIGGYSIRVLRNRMDEDSRRDLDSRLDFRILD
jgi:uncharacterized protein YegJ (DUF2314 family)